MHIKAFLMKLVITTAALWIVLGMFYHVNFTDVLITSIVVTVVGFLGDLFVLPKIGNVLAAISDFVLVMVIVWILGASIFDETIALGTASFISALVLMIGELYLHRYMESHIFEPQIKNPERKTGYYQRTDLQTEFAEEVDIDEVTRKIKERQGKPSPKKTRNGKRK
ncbi:YndM family protein [Bacillus sp. FJAT-22090]|uniref:YndM family protein n=1 Tax=Bacillus sp. FJAT-22090 TaxID=1581038 RepID=UPI0011A7D929|nr:YndM family protein [Bacillus sp. FJAT-22090]